MWPWRAKAKQPRPVLRVSRVRDGAVLPKYMSDGAAGMDLKAVLENAITITPRERVCVPTGLALEVPEGFEAQIRSRSGLASQLGLAVLDAPGTIDSDYRGEVSVLLVNLGKDIVVLTNGNRIAQLIVAPVARVHLKEVRWQRED